jgi:hypothetical protein
MVAVREPHQLAVPPIVIRVSAMVGVVHGFRHQDGTVLELSHAGREGETGSEGDHLESRWCYDATPGADAENKKR